MKKMSATLLAMATSAFCSASAFAASTLNLFDWATYADGFVLAQPGSPTVPGTIASLTFNTVGSHLAIGFVDPEIDEAANTFFNEYGEAIGSASSGQTWEIDEPGYVFGDIRGNFLAGTLDNTNGVPSTTPDDVSMALGWDFNLAAGDSAVVRYFLTESAPTSGFYLAHSDPDSQVTWYFSSTLEIKSCPPGTPDCNQVPEPSTAWLLGPALVGLLASRRRLVKAA